MLGVDLLFESYYLIFCVLFSEIHAILRCACGSSYLMLFSNELEIFAECHELMKIHCFCPMCDIIKALMLKFLLVELAVKLVDDGEVVDGVGIFLSVPFRVAH